MRPNGANAYTTTLDVAVDADDTTFVVLDSPPTELIAPFKFRVVAEGANENEICTATAIGGTGNKTWTVTRASEPWNGDTSATSHAAGATVEQNLTIGTLQDAGGFLAAAAVGGVGQSTSSSTPVVVDASLDLTFVIPSSGKVIFEASANFEMDSGFNGYVVVLESTTNVGEIVFWSAGNSPDNLFSTVRIPVSGITAGTRTYRLAIRTNGGGTMKVLSLSAITFTATTWP